jgi:fluoride exporter
VSEPATFDLADESADRSPTPTRATGSAVRRQWLVLAAVSAGGMVGALARHGLTTVFPPEPARFAWVTFGVNASGCLAMGVLTVMVTQVLPKHRLLRPSLRPLLRPFLGVGVLGGFTTFSAYSLDAVLALRAGAVATALAYVVWTLAAALAAVWVGATLTRWAVGRHAS